MKRLQPHLAYLHYVLRHKWMVFRAGLRLGVPVWRLIVHDLSKFSFAEWGAYVHNFYGESATDQVMREFGVTVMEPTHPDYIDFTETLSDVRRARQAAFDTAWLHHQHHNPHHWQHWILNEDSGAKKYLLMPPHFVIEMVADWIGAGNKVMQPGVTLEACAREAAAWYVKNRDVIQLRALTRDFVESLLIEAATWAEDSGPEPDQYSRMEALKEKFDMTNPSSPTYVPHEARADYFGARE